MRGFLNAFFNPTSRVECGWKPNRRQRDHRDVPQSRTRHPFTQRFLRVGVHRPLVSTAHGHGEFHQGSCRSVNRSSVEARATERVVGRTHVWKLIDQDFPTSWRRRIGRYPRHDRRSLSRAVALGNKTLFSR